MLAMTTVIVDYYTFQMCF